MKLKYINKRFSIESLRMIEQANSIISEYQARGYDLTLRQLYYQFVSRNLIKNKQKEYSRLGNIINNARLAGLVDWNSIVDRTRNMRSNQHWNTPQEILEAAANSFYMDHWSGQQQRLQVWIEKDALLGVISRVCKDNDITYFSCRGYVSQSEMWEAGTYIGRLFKQYDILTHVLHLGDHDPSGIDMTRDIHERLSMFAGIRVPVHRGALNMEQIKQYNPPPNPAKTTDSRFQGYIKKYGHESWELDALDPDILVSIIQRYVSDIIDTEIREKVLKVEKQHKEKLLRVSCRYNSYK